MANPRSKLSDKQIRDIYQSKLTGAALAERYGVHPTTIAHIWGRKQKRYINLTEDLPKRPTTSQMTSGRARAKREQSVGYPLLPSRQDR